MKIGNLDISSRLALAPMAGVTDLAFRKICGELGADLTLTETFLKMGVDEFSVNPVSILPLRGAIRRSSAR